MYPIRKLYISVKYKFFIASVLASIWMIFSIYLSLDWLKELASITNWFWALFIINGIAYIPGWINAFLVVSLLLDK